MPSKGDFEYEKAWVTDVWWSDVVGVFGNTNSIHALWLKHVKAVKDQ